MKLRILENKRFRKWCMRTFLFLGGLCILIFNDVFGESEVFGFIAFLYFLLVSFLFLRWVFLQIRAIISLKNEKAKTELMHLQSQVNPHFFFNILNNLYGLVDKDPQKAKDLILKLSDMMRYSIYEGQKNTVTLSEEVAYLQNYIELHKMRYYKDITITFNHTIHENDYQIMPLLFIILVENAFKHGVENLRKNAYVTINMRAEKHKVEFDIENNFDPTEENTKEGIGLKNLKRRLELVYPDRHDLTFSKSGDIYTANLVIKGL